MSEYTTAEYLRLSCEDTDLKQTGKLESNSISNQRSLLNTFISRTPELAGSHVVEFCDDGWSGKNFERPAFQEMISQVRQGKIQCIVVKDLSRFGRDHLTVGNYIANIFPFLGVRFIAVNDGFDSIRPADVDSLETSFKVLLYDLYSRDLSRKVRSAKRSRAQRGDFMSPFAPYGYDKDSANKNHLVIDQPAAEVVRRVFLLAEDKHTPQQIARLLNHEAVPTPMLYKRETGCSRTKWQSLYEYNFWTEKMVAKILRDERYIGTNIYGKRIRDVVGHYHTVKVRREEWITVENTHEGIVTREEFDCAQKAMKAFREHDSPRSPKWPLYGKVRCGVCGYMMNRSRGKKPHFTCYTPRVNEFYQCAERIPESDVLEAVDEGLRVQAFMAVELRRLWEEQRQKEQKDTISIQRTLSRLREIYQQQSQQMTALYESFALGEISKEEYLKVKAVAVKQKDVSAARIAELEAALENTDSDGHLDNPFVSVFGKYYEVQEITKEIISEVLNVVYVYPNGRLEIVWNCQDDLEKLVLDLQ